MCCCCSFYFLSGYSPSPPSKFSHFQKMYHGRHAQMYHGRHACYRHKLRSQYANRLPINLYGTEETNKRAIWFYKWFYAQILPCGCRGTMRGSWLRRMEALYCRDLKRLHLKTVKIEGALSSLCEIRGMDPPDAWKAYLLRWGGYLFLPVTNPLLPSDSIF
jgi:hypothetical protein